MGIKETPDDLYQQFMVEEVNEAFDMAKSFEDLTSAHLQVLVNLRAKRSLDDHESYICKKLEVMLKEERNTWRLAKALYKDQLLTEAKDTSHYSDRMDDSNGTTNHHEEKVLAMHPDFSEEQIMGNFFVMNDEVRRMQLVTDWLEANETDEFDYKNEEDMVEFYTEGFIAWENTFHSMNAKYKIDDIPDLDITGIPQSGVELCSSMDPDAPIRTKKSLAHKDKEIEIRLFKHLFRFLRAGELDRGQKLAETVGYHWLSAILDGWLPYSDPNLGTALHQPTEVLPISGNKKRDVWKLTCFRTARTHGLTSYEKAILGVLGGNLKTVLPVCNNWSDQLWARLKCSIDVKVEKTLRDPDIVPQDNRNLTEFPPEFYENYQDLQNIFKSMRDLKIISPFKEATIHQTVQKHFILNDMDGLLNQLEEWCHTLEYDNTLTKNNEAISPQFLRFFAHIVLFVRKINLVTADDTRGTKIIESYINLLTQQKAIESVAYYTVFLPRDNQIVNYAKLLATIDNPEERKHCLKIAKESKLDVDEITQTVVEIIMEEQPLAIPMNASMSELEITRTTANDNRKIDALDYMLYLESKNFVAILHHGNGIMRHFALQRKMDAVMKTYVKLPSNLSECVANQWMLHTNKDISPSLRNNINELEGFRVLLEVQEHLKRWSECHHAEPEEPKKPANMSTFCDNVNYEKSLKQYEHDMSVWKDLRERATNALTRKITEMLYFPGGWMVDMASDEAINDERVHQLSRLRKIFVPQMTSVCFNVLHLTNRYEDCLKVSHLLAQEDLRLYDEFTKVQLREFLDKISEVTKIIIRKSTTES